MPATDRIHPPTGSWVTGLLTRMLVEYLEKEAPHHRPDYDLILARAGWDSPAGGSERLLRDTHAWLPHAVLVELVREMDRATGRKDGAYHAARLFLASRQGQGSLFGVIVGGLESIRNALSRAELWAVAYSDHVQLQAFDGVEPKASNKKEGSAWLIARLDRSRVRPMLVNHHLIQGNCEGLAHLFPRVRSCRCTLEFSEMTLEDLAAELEGHRVERQGERRVIRCGEAVVASAERFRLGIETLRMLGPGGVVPVDGGKGRVACVGEGEAAGPEVWRIVAGGILREGRLAWRVTEGEIFGAPYSRFRVVWEEAPALPAAAERRIPWPAPVEPKESTPEERALAELRRAQEEKLTLTVCRARLERENRALREQVGEPVRALIGESPPMRELHKMIDRVAVSEAGVLILGETGTGKELVAREIHRRSPRASGPFVALNVAALPPGIVESELFGHERGAFTGAAARRLGAFERTHCGTLFLDEVGELPAAVQVKLLRVLQDRSFCRVGGEREVRVDIRVVSATHRNLPSLIESGDFRRDLFYRLNVVTIPVPPLRERREDIPELARRFLEQAARTVGRRMERIDPEAMALLLSYPWPGNVRELENVIQRAVILGDGPVLGLALLPIEVRQAKPAAGAGTGTSREASPDPLDVADDLRQGRTLSDLVDRFQWAVVQARLRECRGNRAQAARSLGRTYRWLRKLELRVAKSSPPEP